MTDIDTIVRQPAVKAASAEQLEAFLAAHDPQAAAAAWFATQEVVPFVEDDAPTCGICDGPVTEADRWVADYVITGTDELDTEVGYTCEACQDAHLAALDAMARREGWLPPAERAAAEDQRVADDEAAIENEVIDRFVASLTDMTTWSRSPWTVVGGAR